LSGVGIRERTQQYRIDNTENGCVCSDTQGEGQDGNGGEDGILAEHSHAEPNVLDYCFAKTCAARFAALLTDSLPIAEALARVARRCFWRHAGGDVFRRALLKVEAQFLVNLPLHRRPLPQRAEPALHLRKWIHDL
jgi:hypothetical protein